jgi:hypothetical protein
MSVAGPRSIDRENIRPAFEGCSRENSSHRLQPRMVFVFSLHFRRSAAITDDAGLGIKESREAEPSRSHKRCRSECRGFAAGPAQRKISHAGGCVMDLPAPPAKRDAPSDGCLRGNGEALELFPGAGPWLFVSVHFLPIFDQVPVRTAIGVPL